MNPYSYTEEKTGWEEYQVIAPAAGEKRICRVLVFSAFFIERENNLEQKSLTNEI
jgi:hypothetical protein